MTQPNDADTKPSVTDRPPLDAIGAAVLERFTGIEAEDPRELGNAALFMYFVSVSADIDPRARGGITDFIRGRKPTLAEHIGEMASGLMPSSERGRAPGWKDLLAAIDEDSGRLLDRLTAPRLYTITASWRVLLASLDDGSAAALEKRESTWSSPRKRAPKKAPSNPRRSRVGEGATILSFEELPTQYRELTYGDTVGAMALAFIGDRIERQEVIRHLGGSEQCNPATLQRGLFRLADRFKDYFKALNPTLQEDKGFSLCWSLAKRIIGILEDSSNIRTVAEERSIETEKVKELLGLISRRVLFFHLSQDADKEQLVFEVLKTASATRASLS